MRVGENRSPFQFGVVRCVLAGDDADLPGIVPKERDLGVYRYAAVVEAPGDHLEGLGAHHLTRLSRMTLKERISFLEILFCNCSMLFWLKE